MIKELATGGILRRPNPDNPGGSVAGYAGAVLSVAQELKRLHDSQLVLGTGAGKHDRFRAGHMGWGVDRRARWTQPLVQTLEAGCGGADIESTLGVVQIELGSNDDIAFGGTNRSRAPRALHAWREPVA